MREGRWRGRRCKRRRREREKRKMRKKTSRNWTKQSWRKDGGGQMFLPHETRSSLGEGLVFPFRPGVPKSRIFASPIGLWPPQSKGWASPFRQWAPQSGDYVNHLMEGPPKDRRTYSPHSQDSPRQRTCRWGPPHPWGPDLHLPDASALLSSSPHPRVHRHLQHGHQEAPGHPWLQGSLLWLHGAAA